MSNEKSKRPATKQGQRRVRLLAPYTIDSNVALVGSVLDLPEQEAHRLEGAGRAVHSPGATPSHHINRGATKRTLSRVPPQTELEDIGSAVGSPLPPADDSEKESPGTGEAAEEVAGDEIDSRINLNTAAASELTAIKGVGKKTAADIIAAREADGPFKSLANCADRVGGVSLEQLEAAGATV